MAKAKKPRSWTNAMERATRALAANKARLESANSTGLASDKTLSHRGYDPNPEGGGPRVPKQVQAAQTGKRRKKRRRR